MTRRFLTCAAATVAAVALATGAPLAQQPDRSKAPVPGAAPALKLPPIQKRALANGLPVWIVEMHEVPVVDVTVIVKAGAAADPVGKYGLASFTSAMLDEGAGSRGALELADAVEFLGASLSTGSSFDASSIQLHTPVSKLDEALPLLAEVTIRPTFPAEEIERMRKNRLTSLLQTRDDASALASAAFARVLYGPRHRFGTPAIGNDASNGEMTGDDLRGFYAAQYQPRNAHVLVVGDVTPDDIMPRLEKTLGAWKNGAALPPVVTLPAATQHGARQIYLVDKPGSAQAQIRIGWIGVGRDTADYYPLDVMNTILGGSFTSRLNQNLREQHGYAYGAGSRFDMRKAPGPFSASAGVQIDKTVESLREFFKELDGMRTPIPAGELERAKNLEALGFPGTFETTSGMAGNLAELVVYNLPESFFNEYVPRIQAVTAADVERVAKQYLQTDRFAVVVVGDLKVIEKPIRDANLGQVRILTV
ncbi:MAG TPA: pitrilysin family protein, partial [Vicinamibacterales bacterium]|nr:pitrilysin family protein [Vicinamibacterales bacterium]